MGGAWRPLLAADRDADAMAAADKALREAVGIHHCRRPEQRKGAAAIWGA